MDKAFIAAYEGDAKRSLHLPEIKPEKKSQQTNVPDDELTQGTEEIEGFQYRVQIAASKAKLNETDIKNIYSGDQEPKYFEEDGYSKYYIAAKSNYFAAKQILNDCGVENAFIVAYKGGVKRVLIDAITAQYRERMARDGFDVKDTILKILTVNFQFDEFTLPPDEKSHLQEFVVDPLKSQDNQYAIVTGHTDVRGSDTYNFGLSEERALSVRKMIIDEGISPEKVKTFYFGESQLTKYCDEHENCDETVHQANRRVEILLLSTKAN